MDGVSRFSGQSSPRISSTQQSSPAPEPSSRQEPEAPPRERVDLFSQSRFESGTPVRAFSEPAAPPARPPPPPLPPDATQEQRDAGARQWQDYCNQFKTNAVTDLNWKKGTQLPDDAANALMHGGKSSDVFVAGRSNVPGNENVPAFFQDFPSSADRQMQLYTFCRPESGQLNPEDSKQWVCFEVYGDICKAYSDPAFTSDKLGTNSVLGFPDSGREDARRTGAPFLDDPLVKDLAQVPFQKFQNGYLVDLGGKVQAFGLDGKRLGTAWPDGKMDAGGVGGPGGPQKPTGPYGVHGAGKGDTSFGNETVQLGTADQYGGAINSLVYDGKEFINNIDHGRQMQVAYSLDGSGETLMPTEAGNNRDADGPTSTTQVQGVSVKDGSVTTAVKPAYWLEPGEAAGGYNGPDARVAKNTTEVSEDILSKTVTAGVGGHSNVIQYDSHIHLAEPHDSIYVEAPTTYLPAEFDHHHRFDPATGESREYGRVHSELDPNDPNANGFKDEAGNVPLIVSTPDGKHAMAIWSPDEARTDLQYRFHQFDFANTGGDTRYNASKMGVTFGMGSNVPQDIATRTYVVVGTVDEVKARLTELYQQNPTGVTRVWPESKPI
ncbi:hypothetical protein [Pyxidicoccus caerfyrddinensis]|uniref:hypothetical protein n=1 Tax=Pyxidicoccus caerfyrddinensis TaxID=2709663 RepID=UPI0013DC3193|nr:hypothetical protein [Pyxidicoccus caerfyrddinensis]